jgi:hypothetical protein
LAAAASTIAMMGSTSAFAFFNTTKIAIIGANSQASGTQTITSVSSNTSNTVQLGAFGNQKAKTNSTANSTVGASQNVQSANVIVVSQ